jgi:hypothetical protein
VKEEVAKAGLRAPAPFTYLRVSEKTLAPGSSVNRGNPGKYVPSGGYTALKYALFYWLERWQSG